MNARKMRKEFLESARRNVTEARKALVIVKERSVFGAKLHMAMVKAAKGAYWISSWCGASGKIYVNVSLKVESFKDDKALLAALSTGIEVMGGSAKFESKDYPENGLRSYSMSLEGFELSINANLIGEGSESCRRVEVGSKMVEVKEYKFVCDGVPS